MKKLQYKNTGLWAVVVVDYGTMERTEQFINDANKSLDGCKIFVIVDVYDKPCSSKYPFEKMYRQEICSLGNYKGLMITSGVYGGDGCAY